MKMKLFNNRRFKHGSLATLITVIFIVAIIVVNIIATLLLERFPLNIDLTQNNRFAMSKDSIDFVKNIDADVKITVCAEENQYKAYNELYTQAYQIIKNYAKYNSNIKLEFVNLVKNPTFAQKYPTETLADADIIVESDLRVTKLASTSLFSSQQGTYGDTTYSSEAEQKMTAALMFVTDKNPTTVSLLAGHENEDVSGYLSLLESNNFAVKTQNLLTEEIDMKSSFVILPAPKVDLSAAEVEKLQTYLDNDGKFGKSIVFVASPNKPVGPILKTFLADWGMEVGSEVIMETNLDNATNNQFTIANQISDEETVAKLKYPTFPLVVSQSNPIKALFEEENNRKTTVIAKSYESAILYTDAKDFDANKAQQGEYNSIVKGTRSKVVDNEKVVSSIVAFGSPSIVSAAFLEYAGYNNADLALTITNSLINKVDSVKIIPVQFTFETINITQGQVKTANMVFIIVIPLALIALMFVIWLRRRHL